MVLVRKKVVELDTGTTGALAQIKAKGFHEKYYAGVEEIFLIGVEFSKTDRNIVRFDWERV